MGALTQEAFSMAAADSVALDHRMKTKVHYKLRKAWRNAPKTAWDKTLGALSGPFGDFTHWVSDKTIGKAKEAKQESEGSAVGSTPIRSWRAACSRCPGSLD